jgi:hypothetical protein
MKSLKNLGGQPASVTLVADDVLEFHAIRLLLLLKICGTADRIDGLTKMAKLDFFVRYPEFFDKVSAHLNGERPPSEGEPKAVESSMVRFHYGPWDRRYYHILSYLESKNLVTVGRENNMYRLRLTEVGKSVAGRAEKSGSFASLVEHMRRVKKLLGGKPGSTLKDLVYKVFGQEVADRQLGEVIQ